MSGKPVKGILLLAFGGADSMESVEPFVKNVLKGRIPTPELIEKARERYRLIGGKSPLLKITEAQGRAIADMLNSDPESRFDYRPFVGMRYWHPYIAETAGKMMAEGVTEGVAVIMSPILSLVATGAYLEDLEAAVGLHGGPAVGGLGGWAHVETLYDIDILFKAVAAEKGIEFRRTPSLNTDPRFMNLLASMIKKVAEQKQ